MAAMHYLYRLGRTAWFVVFREVFYCACGWIQFVGDHGAPAWLVNLVGRTMGSNWALRQCWRVDPEWISYPDEYRRIRLY